ncbi:HVO_A0114 family putative DNA-binding protein [Azospirillum sp. sgz301742]
MTKRNIFVSYTALDDAAKRFVEVWKKAERGEVVEPEDNVSFVSWSALSAVMTDKRHELLRHLHRNPAPSMRALARDLGRDYKRVHEDVEALASVGLVEKEGRALRAPVSEIHAVISL